MGKYKIADLSVEIINRYDYLSKQCKDYECKSDAPADVSVTVADEDIQRELNFYKNGSKCYLESICAYRKIADELYRFDGLVMHGSVIEVNGRGIAFLAPSGVGKTTHTFMWKQFLGDKVTVVNGDKPVVRFINDEPFAFGTPWAGKEKLQINTSVRLTDICFINRSSVNDIKSLDVIKSERLISQIYMPKRDNAVIKTLELVDRFNSSCRFWDINCLPDINAAKTAYETIVGDFDET